MDRKLFENIKSGVKAVEGRKVFEELTGRTPASVQIAKDWLKALKDIVANDADALTVSAEFDKRINAEVAKGDLSDIYATIRQQMPDIVDLGMVAANMETIESWLRQGNAQNESGDITPEVEVNASIEANSIEKTDVETVDDDTLDVTNSNANGTQGDEIIEGYYADPEGDIFFVSEQGDAFYVDNDGAPIEEAFLGNVYEDEIQGQRIEESDEDTIQPYELFEDDDGDVVYFNENGDLLYATNEDINIYYNNDDAEGFAGGEGEAAVEDEEPAPAQDAQEPMQVELINNGQSGEVNGVVVDVAGKHIEIGPDGTVNEAPSGEDKPQQSVQEALSGKRYGNLLRFFESNDDYSDVERREPKTATGGEFQDGVDHIDPEALDRLNHGEDITDGKSVEEAYVLFEDEDGDIVYFNESGDLLYATAEEIAEALNELSQETKDSAADKVINKMRGSNAADQFQTIKKYPKILGIKESDDSYDHITVPRGLGKSIRAPKGRMATDKFQESDGGSSSVKAVPELDTPQSFCDQGHKDFDGKSVSAKGREEDNAKYEQLSHLSVVKKMTRGINESWRQSLEDLFSEHGVQPNQN